MQSEHCRLEKEVKLQALAKQLNAYSLELQNSCDLHHQFCVCDSDLFPRQATQMEGGGYDILPTTSQVIFVVRGLTIGSYLLNNDRD